MGKFFRCFGLVLTAAFLATTPACQPPIRQPGPDAGYLADVPPADLRDILASLARAHEQKLQLVFYVSLPWTGIDPAFRDFYSQMAREQGDLNKELKAWAKARDLDLTFQFTPDVLGKAQETMEDRQQKVILADNRTDLTRDTLIQMSMDYEWQISVLQNLLPKTHDPALRAYLEHSLKIHLAGSAQLTALIKRFKAI